MYCLNLCEEARNLITDVQVDIPQEHRSTLKPVCVSCGCCCCCCYGLSLRVILVFKTVFAMIFPSIFFFEASLRNTGLRYTERPIMHSVGPGMSLLAEVVFLFPYHP